MFTQDTSGDPDSVNKHIDSLTKANNDGQTF